MFHIRSRWLWARCPVCAVFCALFGLAVGGCATMSKEPVLSAAQRQLNVESFDEIWTTIRDTHWDPELGGLDWDGLREQYRPRVESAKRMSQARRPMRKLIASLQQTHFSIIPSELIDELATDDGDSPRDGGTGLGIRVIDGQPLVVSVYKNSPGDKLGIATGWVVMRVGDDVLQPILEELNEELAEKSYREGQLARAVQGRMRGAIGESVEVEFLDGDDQTVIHDITLTERRGKKIRLGHLPPFHIWFESRRLPGNIGYIAFNGFMDPNNVMGGYNKAVVSFMDADGIIIDLRGNPGGIGGMAMGMAGWLIDASDQRLGTMYMKSGELNFVVNPRAQTYSGPVVVLVDCETGSTSEIFSGGLKDLGRATIVGTRTAGAALPATMSKLPNGDGFLHAIANYVSQGGEELEGIGVEPHIEVEPTRQQLLAGGDPVLERAIAVIEDNKIVAVDESN